MGDLSLFIPITKVDARQRLVFGVATAEVEDRAGEICDYASTKPYYQRWSDEIAQSTNGKSLGNLRAMHSPIAAGKVTAITFNDEARQIEICAKVVDDAEWNKVTEGVYTGFSQGGSYERRWTDDNGQIRYTAMPDEISLVDLPCLPQARFEMIKADGTREFANFDPIPNAAAKLDNLVAELDRLESRCSDKLHDVPGLVDLIVDLQELSARLTAILRATQSAEEGNRIRGPHGTGFKANTSDSAEKADEIWMQPNANHGHRESQKRLARAQRPCETTSDIDPYHPTTKMIPWPLQKQFDVLTSTLADVLQRVKNIEQQPLPLPLSGASRAVAKHEDGTLDLGRTAVTDSLLADPEALSLLAIRLAQRNARGPHR